MSIGASRISSGSPMRRIARSSSGCRRSTPRFRNSITICNSFSRHVRDDAGHWPRVCARRRAGGRPRDDQEPVEDPSKVLADLLLEMFCQLRKLNQLLGVVISGLYTNSDTNAGAETGAIYAERPDDTD